MSNRALTLVLITLILVIFSALRYFLDTKIDNKPPSPQEMNLKKLERAKTGELVVCRDVSTHSDKMAVLVQQNTGVKLSGRQYKKESTEFRNNIPYSDFENCRIRILRSKETPYSLVVGDIILGVGPPL